jgi:hypothetical protein
MGDKWRKSSFSASMGDCVEVSSTTINRIMIRDSKAPDGPHLHFSSSAWTSFLDACKEAALQAKNEFP